MYEDQIFEQEEKPKKTKQKQEVRERNAKSTVLLRNDDKNINVLSKLPILPYKAVSTSKHKQQTTIINLNKQVPLQNIRKKSFNLANNNKYAQNKKLVQQDIYNDDFQDGQDTKFNHLNQIKLQTKQKSFAKIFQSINQNNGINYSFERAVNANRYSQKTGDKQITILVIEQMKQIDKVDQSFNQTQEDLLKLNVDKLNRLNNRVRVWMQNLSYSMNLIIDEAIIKARLKKNYEKASKSLQNKIKIIEILENCIRNNTIILQNYQRQSYRLISQQGQLKKQQYQFLIDKKKDQIKQCIKQYKNEIIKLKKQSKFQEKKLISNQSQDKGGNRKNLNIYKDEMVNLRRQQDKNTERIKKIDEKMAKLQINNIQQQQKYQQLCQRAKEMNINIQFIAKDPIIQTLKKKVEYLKTMRLSSENIHSRTVIKLNNKIKLLANEMKHIQQDTYELNSKIHIIQDEALKLIQKNKTQNLSKSSESQPSAFAFFQHKNISINNVIKSKLAHLKEQYILSKVSIDKKKIKNKSQNQVKIKQQVAKHILNKNLTQIKQQSNHLDQFNNQQQTQRDPIKIGKQSVVNSERDDKNKKQYQNQFINIDEKIILRFDKSKQSDQKSLQNHQIIVEQDKKQFVLKIKKIKKGIQEESDPQKMQGIILPKIIKDQNEIQNQGKNIQIQQKLKVDLQMNKNTKKEYNEIFVPKRFQFKK